MCDIEMSKDTLQSNNSILHGIDDHAPTLHQPSLETFLRDFLRPQVPVKITGKVTKNFPFEKLNILYEINYK